MQTSPRILVVRLGRTGDMVMITPALNALLAAYPDAQIQILTTLEGRRVLNGYHARLSRFLIYPSGILGKLLGWHRVLGELRAQRFAHAYVFEAATRYHKLLRNVAGSTHLLPSISTERHYCERCLSLVEQSLDRPVERSWVGLPVNEEGRGRAAAYLRDHGIEEGACLVGFHATFSSATALALRKTKARLHRSWPGESFVRLALLLQQHAQAYKIPLRIIMDVLPAERRLVEPIIEESRGSILMVSAPPDFERYKAVLEQMSLFVTPDTGPMHIAAAVGTPLVALFSHMSPGDCGPYVPARNYTALRAEDTCHPERGLAAISPESVFSACLPFLSRFS